MGQATRRGRKLKKDRAVDVAENFSFYVNPQASRYLDPEGLQAQAFPLLQQWREDGILKEMLLRAIVHFNNDFAVSAEPLENQWLFAQAQIIARYILPQIQQSLDKRMVFTGNGAQFPSFTPHEWSSDDNIEEDEFINELLHYNSDYND
jgi:hypothetical protein